MNFGANQLACSYELDNQYTGDNSQQLKNGLAYKKSRRVSKNIQSFK
jgi:hypothetical protein